jgi:hypothetical protein
LGVDFPAAGRTEAGFADLLEKVGPRWDGYGFWLTVPPPARLDRAVSGQDYVRQWTAEIRGSGRQVVAVMGYCAGSVYAAAIAEDIARWQQPAPKVILFDPEADTGVLADEMYKEMYRLIGVFGGFLSAEETEYARKRTAELAESGLDDLFAVSAALVDLYRETGSAAFDKLRLSDGRRDEIIGYFESWLAWLYMTTQIDPSDTWQRSPAIMSTEYVAMTRQQPVVKAETRISIGREIALEVSHTDLLGSDFTVQQVFEEMKAG